MKKIKALILFISLIMVILFASESYAKYVIERCVIAASIKIDRSKPIGNVNYVKQENTNDKVLVIVKASEPICDIENWNLSEDKLILSKIYEKDTTDTITLVDLAGNTGTVEINTQNIKQNFISSFFNH